MTSCFHSLIDVVVLFAQALNRVRKEIEKEENKLNKVRPSILGVYLSFSTTWPGPVNLMLHCVTEIDS